MSDLEHVLRIGPATWKEIASMSTPQAVLLRHRIEDDLRQGVGVELVQ